MHQERRGLGSKGDDTVDAEAQVSCTSDGLACCIAKVHAKTLDDSFSFSLGRNLSQTPLCDPS